MKSSREKMSILNRKTSGGAMVFVIIALAVMALVGASFLKDSWKRAAFGTINNRKDLLDREGFADADYIREQITRKLDQETLPNPTFPQADTTSHPQIDDASAFASNIANWVSNYNNTHQAQQTTLSLECIGQGYGNLREPCTLRRARDPKIFNMTLSKFVPEQNVYLKISQEFVVKRQKINDYAYLITNSHNDVRLGAVSFSQPIGIFFSQDAPNQSIVFSSTTSPGTQIQFLSTNLPAQESLQQVSGAIFTVSSAEWGASAEGFVSAIDRQFEILKAEATTINHVNDQGNTPQRQAVIDACTVARQNNGNTGSCSYETIGRIRYEIPNSNTINLVETYGWILRDAQGVPIQSGNNSDTAFMPYSQIPGAIYYLPGEAWIMGDLSSPRTDAVTLSQRQTLMADSFKLKNSILSNADTKINSAIFAKGNITLSDANELTQAFILRNTGSKTLREVKQAQVNYTNSTESATFQVSLVPGGNGSIIIPPAFYDSNSEFGNNPITLGKMSIRGMIISGEPIISSASYEINWWSPLARAGFTRLDMSAEGLQYPPPGMNFAVNSTLISLTTSSTMARTPMDEAIRVVSRQQTLPGN